MDSFLPIRANISGPEIHMDTYQYAPLPLGNMIRLLNLEPGTGSEPLRGKLVVAALADKPQYFAASYVWGDTFAQEVIILDKEKPHKLSKSLAQALRRFRLADRPCTIWADQICINQQNTSERNVQVKFMNQIYRNAAHVMVWLGEDDNGDAKSAFNLVKTLGTIFSKGSSRKEFEKVQSISDRQAQDWLWQPLRNLYELPWFRRVWIAQEIGTRPPATLFWGDEKIDWSTLAHFSAKLKYMYHPLRVKYSIFPQPVTGLYKKFVEPSTNRNQSRYNFIHELHKARDRKATDARDHVYALLGHYSALTGPDDMPIIEANYEISVAEMNCQLACRSLVHYENLITLNAVQHTRELFLSSSMFPSWVPRWNSSSLYLLGYRAATYKAASRRAAQISFQQLDRVLSIEGANLDVIETCSRRLQKEDFKQIQEARKLIQALWTQDGTSNAMNLSDRYFKDTGRLFALLQTLSGECSVIAASRAARKGDSSTSDRRCLTDGLAWLVKTMGYDDKLDADIVKISRRGYPTHWERNVQAVSHARKFVTTKKGYFALCPEVVEPGDLVCLLMGGVTPYCLRREGDHFLFLGECYVHGFMHGEGLEMLESGDLKLQSFELH